MQAGEKLLLSCGGEEVFLLLVACQVHHPGSDVCYYEHLKEETYENGTLAVTSIMCIMCNTYNNKICISQLPLKSDV